MLDKKSVWQVFIPGQWEEAQKVSLCFTWKGGPMPWMSQGVQKPGSPRQVLLLFLTLIIRSEIEPCRHFEDLHQPGEFPCPGDEKLCGKVFTSRNKMSSHYSRWDKLFKEGSRNENSFLGTATPTILPEPKPSQEEELRLDYDSLSSWDVSKLSDFQLPLSKFRVCRDRILANVARHY